MQKVVHLTSVHIPTDTRIFHKECKTLIAAGYQVVLIAPNGQDPSATTLEGIRLHGLAKPRNRRERMTRSVWQIYRAALRETADLYHFHDPELMVVGLLLKASGKKVFYDVHEDFPRQILTRHWLHPMVRSSVARGVDILERVSSHIMDGIVVVTPTIAQRFPERKRVLVQNYPVPNELVIESPLPYTQRLPIVTYVGKIETPRGAQEMIEAMGYLPESLSARMSLAGTFEPAGLEQHLRQLPGWERVTPLGWLSRPDVASLLGKSRIGLILLHPAESHLAAQPNKLFEYMAAGIPVVASNFPNWRKVVGQEQCGLLVDPLDAVAIADAIEWLLTHPEEAEAMGRRGQDAVRRIYNWQPEGERLVEFYRSVLAR